MKMKASQILLGGGAYLLSSAAMAFGYSSVDNAVTGNLPNAPLAFEHHAIQSYTPTDDCGAQCQGASLDESELTIMMRLVNQSGCAVGGDGTCDPAPAVTDTWNGKNVAGGGASFRGGSASGAEPEVTYLMLFAPERSPGPHALQLAAPTSPLFTLTDWKFTTAPNGKIDSGHIIGTIDLTAVIIIGTFNFEDMTLTTYYAAEPDTQAEIDCLVEGPHIIGADSPTIGEGQNCETELGGALSRSAEFEYITAGMAQLDLGKAVPVPAFAAAVLGLGLLGLTVLSGRRRQVK